MTTAETIIATPPGTGSVRGVMGAVLLALVPGLAVQCGFFGPAVLVQIVLALATAWLAEAAALRLRGRPLRPALGDLSVSVTGVLLALAIPCLAPAWVIVVGTLFAVLFGKQVYGGLGCNPFNPAMLGYAVLLIAFPREMTRWPVPLDWLPSAAGMDRGLAAVFGQFGGEKLDALARATPLDVLRTELSRGALPRRDDSLAGLMPWAWSNLAYLAGGLWLWRRRILDGRLPAAMLAMLALCAVAGYLADDARYPSPLFHLLGGGTLLAAFFIATDPVSAPATPRGRLLHGAGIGLLAYVIRTFGGYPDGIAFAVLLMNFAAPTLDHWTRPRVYGHDR